MSRLLRGSVCAALLGLLPACRGGKEGSSAGGEGRDTAHAPAAMDTTYPAVSRGTLVAHSAVPTRLGGDWVPVAASCATPPSLQLLARGDSVDVLLLLHLPADPSDAGTGTYEVPAPDDTAAGAWTARVGVQRMQFVDLGYQGVRGRVELERLDRVATGRFDVVLREVGSTPEIRYLGAFDRVPVDSAPTGWCRPLGRDSATAVR